MSLQHLYTAIPALQDQIPKARQDSCKLGVPETHHCQIVEEEGEKAVRSYCRRTAIGRPDRKGKQAVLPRYSRAEAKRNIEIYEARCWMKRSG